jgi:hypothetical protein
MSERWKYQLRWGALWGTFMAIGMTAFNAFENENWRLFLSYNFLLRLVIFNFISIFFVAYFAWKDKEKEHAGQDK